MVLHCVEVAEPLHIDALDEDDPFEIDPQAADRFALGFLVVPECGKMSVMSIGATLIAGEPGTGQTCGSVTTNWNTHRISSSLSV